MFRALLDFFSVTRPTANLHAHSVSLCYRHLHEHCGLALSPVAQTLPAPQVITDPKQIASKPNAHVEQNQQSLSIEKLYMTRQIGGAAWSPDGKTIAFVTNISGRNNLWLVPAEGGWPTQLTISDQRQSRACLVARRQMDRLHVRLRRR